METLYENFIGPFIFVSLILLILFAFIIPRMKFSQRFRITESYFIITNVCGFICGALGITAILFYDPEMVQLYLWKLLIIPYVYLQIYTIYVMISRKTLDILDEKQEFNMATAGGITLGFTIILMALVVLPLIQSDVIELSLLFPFYVNSVILIFSVVTLFLFKRA